MTDLKTCPFCGGIAGLHGNYSYKYKSWFVFVKCMMCGSSGKTFMTEKDPEETDWKDDGCNRAITAWNMRKEN